MSKRIAKVTPVSNGVTFARLVVYQTYWRIVQAPSEQSPLARGKHAKRIAQTLSAELPPLDAPAMAIAQTVSGQLRDAFLLSVCHEERG